MTRKTFKSQYRQARVLLKTFSDTSGKHSPEIRRAAEDQWARSNFPPAFQALVASLHFDESLANCALFAYRHSLYANSNWPRLVKEALRRTA